MKLTNLAKDNYRHLVSNPRTVYVLLTLVALVVAAVAGEKWD